MCDYWEKAFSHGLKINTSVLQNVADLVTGHAIFEMPLIWEFIYSHLTTHEKERFSNLRHVWTDRGKGRAFIRATLNEQSLERYVLICLSDPNLNNSYESWSLMRDPEITHLLSTMAAGLGAILFAITVDTPDLNTPSRLNEMWPEPVIAAPIPIKNSSSKKATIIKRKIKSPDDNTLSSSIPSTESRLNAAELSPPSSSSAFVNVEGFVEEADINCTKYLNDVNYNKIEEIANKELKRSDSSMSDHSTSKFYYKFIKYFDACNQNLLYISK